jgi:xanthine dehydrogenase accessory factor
MREILPAIDAWCAAGTRFALATVVQTWQSAPRQPGAAMAVSEHGAVVGSVSGGCIEGAVYDLARQALDTGVPVRETFGVSVEDAFAVGLTCGGAVEVFVHAADGAQSGQLAGLAHAVARGSAAALATVTAGPGPVGARLVLGPDGVAGTFGDAALDRAAVARARGLLERGETAVIRLGRHGEQREDELTLLVETFAPPPRMLIFGANDFAGAMVRMGRFLGYRVTVCDARHVFATAERFPEADDVVVDWPHRHLAGARPDARTVICVLTHDPKFDLPLLESALRTEAAYIGAMGSRRTHEDRLTRLREAGLDHSALSRLHSPIGLDLGARTPEETAMSIAAEIIAHRRGGTGLSLSRSTAPIHH